MKKVFSIAALTLMMTVGAMAQSFIGGGLKVVKTTNTNTTFPGGYVEAGLKLPAGFETRFLGEFSREAELQTIFTRDLNTLSQSTEEFRVRPTLRYNVPLGVRGFNPFIEGGVDIYRQWFEEMAPSSLQSTAGLNPLVTAGFRVRSYEGSYTRIFPDQGSWNNSRLEGHRIGTAYTRYATGSFGFKFSGEYDRVSFREEFLGKADWYRELDSVFRARVGFVFGGRDK